MEILNVLSVDVEEYFQVSAFDSAVSRSDWESFSGRVETNVHRILQLFSKHDARATFFVLGWVARRYPGLVREIASAGHEIGSHGMAHRRIHFQPRDEFREDVRRARDILADQVQKPVVCFRAPSFSIVQTTLWALDVLAEEGFEIDSSISPVRHDLYGIPNARRFPHWQRTSGGSLIFEFPPSSVRLWGNNWPFAGGGVMRLVPYSFTRRVLRRINQIEGQPGMVYFHPWEIDPEQPRIKASLKSRFRHYVNLSKTEAKIERLLQDFRFTTLSNACSSLESFTSKSAA